MKCFNRSKILLIFIAVLLLTFIASCESVQEDTAAVSESAEQTVSTTPSELLGYVIMRSDMASGHITDTAIMLHRAMPELELSTDWVKRGEAVPETGKEILVGLTNRPESVAALEGLRYNDYKITYSGERVVIIGGSDSATAKAAERFISDQSEYCFKDTYRFETPVLNGISLEEYVITVPSPSLWQEDKAAAELNELFIRECGIELKIKNDLNSKDEYEILIGRTEREAVKNIASKLGKNGYYYGFDDDKTKFVITGDNMLGFKYAFANFKADIFSDDSMELDSEFNTAGTAKYLNKELYVDPKEGNDTDNDGSFSKPFATIDAVLMAVRELTASAPYDITVYFADGSYPISKPINITADELGANMAHLTFKNISGAKPVITALTPVSGFTEATVNGVKAWVADMPNELPYSHQAFSADGKRLERPRYPKDTYYEVANVPGYDRPFETAYNEGMLAMNFNKGEFPALSRIDDIQIRLFHYWTDEKIEIKSIDYDENRIDFKNKSVLALKHDRLPKGARYFLDNVYEALSDSGEYYIDRETKKIYYIPYAEEKISDTVIYVSNPTELINIDHAEEITFEGLTFTGSDWTKTTRDSSQAAADIAHAINITYSDYISFTDCTFEHIGNSVMKIDSGCSYIDVNFCNFRDIGANGISIRGTNADPADPEVVIHDINITDCKIESYGRVYANAVGIMLNYAYDCTISHNEIHDGYYTAISCGWVWGYSHHVTNNITIEYNHLYDIGQGMLSDMGGIYTLGLQPGTVIRNNLIHDIQMLYYGGWAIYPDEGSSDILIENNICYNMTAEPFHQHYGENNIVRNNIFAFGDEGQFIITRKEEHNSLTLEGNIMVSKGTPIYAKSINDMNFIGGRNLIWDYVSTSRINKNKMDTVADPLFKDVDNYDFTLSDNSPAFDMGFVPIDISTVGVRNIEKEGNIDE